MTTLPEDIRKTAHQLGTSYHQKSLGEDLTTAIGKALLTERLRCWGITKTMSKYQEIEPGRQRASTFEDAAREIMERK
ncbi:hypothetical protein [Phyllobacterium calauticae]|jgi:hypothetical protein|uniref:hypothetical protein n=1 Tax=Phyllobacterium calauticae TaxID=2817027 RepID=UPI001CBE6AEF|nr:hypothetical protein [Phyllobacterium calauticae]MBZ3693229.1 hypothetical protein [Phyllobacterium calauticae]